VQHIAGKKQNGIWHSGLSLAVWEL